MGDETRDCPACGRTVDVGLSNCPACGGRWNADGSFTPFELPRLERPAEGVAGKEGRRPATAPSRPAPRPTEAARRRRLFLIIGIAVLDLIIALAVILVYLSGALN